ncbi:hypothetical protein E5CHR_03983 [Variovorax sp. PBL-E5]|nr:hypothetical protein E5CHR_03983 [Variovorax sp. PBL-E5]
MHGAPSVSYPVGRSRNADLLVLIIWIFGVGSSVFVSIRFEAFGWRQASLTLGVALASALAWRDFSRRAAPAELSFDGQHWSLSGSTVLRAAAAHVALDLQSLLLVRVIESGRTQRWIWLDRHAKPERWRDLRRAVYSRAPSAGSAAGSGRAASASGHHPLS